jgi:hypothetical protein
LWSIQQSTTLSFKEKWRIIDKLMCCHQHIRMKYVLLTKKIKSLAEQHIISHLTRVIDQMGYTSFPCSIYNTLIIYPEHVCPSTLHASVLQLRCNQQKKWNFSRQNLPFIVNLTRQVLYKIVARQLAQIFLAEHIIVIKPKFTEY